MSHDEPTHPIITLQMTTNHIQLCKQDFLKFRSFLSINDLNQILTVYKSPSQLNRVTSQFTDAINVILYYVLSIQSNVKLFQGHNFNQDYKQLCSKRLTEFYIKSNMDFDIPLIAGIISLILGINLEECAHIIFYLVYGRFATHPYIRNICKKNQHSNPNAHKRDESKVDISFKNSSSGNFKINHKSKGSIQAFKSHSKKKTVNDINQLNQISLTTFTKQLRSTLTNTPLQSHLPSTKCSKKSNQTKLTTQSLKPQPGAFTPIPTQFRENSFLFDNLPFHRTQQSFRDTHRKGLMRKLRFSEKFDANQLTRRVRVKKTPVQLIRKDYSVSKIQENTFVNLTQLEMGKITYQELKKLQNNLRIQGKYLDQARIHSKTTRYESNNSQSQKLKHTNTTNKKGFDVNISQPSNSNKREHFPFICQQKLSIQTNYSSNFSNADCFAQSQYVNISLPQEQIIKKEQKKQKGNNEGYFQQSFACLRKLNCKNRVQKFKSQYRKFMKTQLLQKIRSV